MLLYALRASGEGFLFLLSAIVAPCSRVWSPSSPLWRKPEGRRPRRRVTGRVTRRVTGRVTGRVWVTPWGCGPWVVGAGRRAARKRCPRGGQRRRRRRRACPPKPPHLPGSRSTPSPRPHGCVYLPAPPSPISPLTGETASAARRSLRWPILGPSQWCVPSSPQGPLPVIRRRRPPSAAHRAPCEPQPDRRLRTCSHPRIEALPPQPKRHHPVRRR